AITFIIGWLAIAGVPPFAGFWSKDEILLFAYDKSPVLYAVGLVTALLTAYYMTRQVVMVFYGKARWHDAHAEHGAHGDLVLGDDAAADEHAADEHAAVKVDDAHAHADDAHGEHTPHESPWIMLLPLVVLAGLSMVGGFIQLPFSKSLHRLEHWLEPVVEEGEHHLSAAAQDLKYVLMAVAVAAGLTGITAAVMVYAKHKAKPIEPQILADGWKYDSAVSAFMGGPGRAAFDAVTWADSHVVDGAVNGAGALVKGAATGARKVQSGNVRTYAAGVGVGVVLLLVWFVLLRGVL
ncbi:MAG: NADH-quinone oxidoreductase subunit, partial [Actinomycetota bacterium]